jgi:hypothetical protein
MTGQRSYVIRRVFIALKQTFANDGKGVGGRRWPKEH